MEFHFLEDLVVVFAIGGVVVYALRQLKLPPIVGLLLAGAAMGPHGLSLVGDVHRVEVLAEIGVVLLLFTIGLEFSLAQLMRMGRVIVAGGGGQVALTIGAVALATLWHGEGLATPAFFGFLASMSSTAIVLRVLGERAELDSPFGRVTLGILLFQDLCIVPLMLLTPFLAGKGEGGAALILTLGRAVAVVAGVVVAARYVVPPVLLAVVRTRSRELFLTLLLVLCLGTAWLTSLAGLSLALGAFLAGLAISESEYSHQAMAEAVPFRDAFGSLFFVSIGMLMDVKFVVFHAPLVAAVVLAVVVVKTVAAAGATLGLGYPLGVALRVGLGLAQVGEFAFVMSKAGVSLGLIGPLEYQVFLSASVITMVITPALLRLGQVLALRLPERRMPGVSFEKPAAPREGHVIIAGYGMNGQNLARALGATGIPYDVLEMNPESVRAAKARGEPLHYGDCTRAAVLEGLNIAAARMYVVAISDAASSRQSVSLARVLNPDIHIIVRTRFVHEVDELKRIGANEVIPEEFETSIEIFARVLERFQVPRNVVLDQVHRIRGDMYEMLRSPTRAPARAVEVDDFEGVHIERVEVLEDSPAAGKTIAELAVRKKTGASVLAVRRDGAQLPNPAADFRFAAGDVIVVMGDRHALDSVLLLVDPSVPLS